MQEQIDKDLKTALLAGEKKKVETLRGLKSALQYEAVSLSLKKEDLSDQQIQKVFARESKKRQEAADLYKNANESQREQSELVEKRIIDAYLPEQLPEEEVRKIVDQEVAKIDQATNADMGRIIGAVKDKLQGQADGSVIARLVKERLS